MNVFPVEPDQVVSLPRVGAQPAVQHVFDADSVEAVACALVAGRPLLIRGEPGAGKSQLARAAASVLNRAFLPFTVDARTEARDLQFTVDLVARLAEAQIAGHRVEADSDGQFDPRERLASIRFTSPGPLWWAFDWLSAQRQVDEHPSTVAGTTPWTPEGWQPADGVVLLIDEIDKADTAVPNGLLEALGQGEFRLPDRRTISAAKGAASPLVVLTTNEERALPDAFVRRCLVLHLGWPTEKKALIEALVTRGRAQFPDLDASVMLQAAEQLADDRETVAEQGLCPPGGAEYLDMLRTLDGRWPDDPEAQSDALKSVGQFFLKKHLDETPW